MRKPLILLSAGIGLFGSLALSLTRINDGLRIDVLDVGQGDAILLSMEGYRVLIDGGPDTSVLEQLGEVLPLWDRDIDLVVLTHPHDDHVAGLIPVLERFNVEAVLLSGPNYDSDAYEAFLAELQTHGIPTYFARADEDFLYGDLALDVLYPFESLAGQSIENVNDSSVMIRATYKDHSLLLTGDAETEVEAQLVDSFVQGKIELEADILKAGHHGSSSSTSLDFLEAVSPEIFVISCGTGNDYGHPHASTMENAEDAGVEIWRTDLDGRVTMLLD